MSKSQNSVLIAAFVLVMLLGVLCFGQDPSSSENLTVSGPTRMIAPAGTGRGPRFSIEKLSESEVADLSAAQRAFAEAQGNLAAVEYRIRHNHGQRSELCDTSEKLVTFFGDYALITDQPKGGCVSW